MFDLLDKIRPDHEIGLTEDNKVYSISTDLMDQLGITDIKINVPIDNLMLQLLSTEENEFVDNIKKLLSKHGNIGLALLRSGYMKGSQLRGTLIYIIRYNHVSRKLEFFNLILLVNQFHQFFNPHLWNEISTSIQQNRDNFISKQLYLAYQTFLPLFLSCNLSFDNMQAKFQYEYGNFLNLLNPRGVRCLNKSTGRNLLCEGIKRSEYDLEHNPNKYAELCQKTLPSNTVLNHYFSKIIKK